ncbi:serine/threonine-protein kinase [Streptomyces sp. AK02-04a]|uniref:serine/threonine-protein kinase n=1 Tax=Streptomyces sp. AK02-04a TaxID=3028649 RepID=UPI0029B1DAF0|nr:protein kinase [Streptomyces sp. AK02-04a]MDX3760805.1 protein kinase [Streptomyces sp. AK02-04a]
MAGETPDQGEGRIIGGRYRLLRTLGVGGMGRVWLAYDAELACEVSMKEIALPDVPMDTAEHGQRVARARSEARHAARLRGHPHVVTVHDVVVHEGLPWIVMEYVPDAVDLQAVVRQSGPLSPARAARIGLAVLDALSAGHRIGILHRDVKPANILLAPDSSGDPYARVLLTDYGIALQPESREPRLTATAGILGTPGYLAPERARGEPPTPAADLFSLGATLYAAVEGRGPFDRPGQYATLTALLGEEPTPPVRAGELTSVLHGLLVKDPLRRSSPEAVARGLERVVQTAAGGMFGPPPGYPAGLPPGYVAGPSPGYAAGPSPGYAAGAPPGHATGSPPGTPQTPGTPQAPGTPQTPGGPQIAGVPQTSGVPQGPGIPQTSGAPPTPNTPYHPNTPQNPNTPHTPPGGPAAPGGPLGPASGTPPAYGAWRPSTPSGAYEWNPYAGTGAPTRSTAGPPLPPARRRRPLVPVVALVVGVLLVVVGGTWAAVSLAGDDGGTKDATAKKRPTGSPSSGPTGPVYPYGEQVGLTKPLQAGDCVKAVWSGPAFKSALNLGVVNCAKDWPDGQVVAVDTADDYADAVAHGAQRCTSQSAATADALPDAGVYAVAPTKDGFGAAKGGTACLVLGRHVAIGGEVGRFRDAGVNLWPTQMGTGDCWSYAEKGKSFDAHLADCGEPHTDQVIGTAQAAAGMDYKKALAQGGKLCTNKFASSWASDTEHTVSGWLASEEEWNQGFNKVLCTVRRVDGTRTSERIPDPATV